MTHEFAAASDRFMYYGYDFESASLTEAWGKAGLLYNVADISMDSLMELATAVSRMRDQVPPAIARQVEQIFGDMQIDSMVGSSGHRVMIRERGTEGEYINRVTDRYVPVQHRQVAEAFDPLAEKYPVVWANALGNRGAAAAFSLGTHNPLEVEGEEISRWMLIQSVHGTSGSISLTIIQRRLFCKNQFPSLLDRPVFDRLTHMGDAHTLLPFVARLTERLVQAQTAEDSRFRMLAKISLEGADLVKLVDAVFPVPSKPRSVSRAEMGREFGIEGETVYETAASRKKQWERDMEAATEHREAVMQEYEQFSAAFPNMAGTLYAFANAVTARVSHYSGRTGSAEAYGKALLFGSRAAALDRMRVAVNRHLT